MIPILYEQGETAFTANGLGRLRDCISCVCTEGRNDVYEVDFEYPVDGVNYDRIQCGRIICVEHDESGDVQPFDIVSYSRPIKGVVTFHAVHISYRQTALTVSGTNISTLSGALTLLASASPSNPFTYWTDKSGSGFMASADGVPHSVRQMLGGMEGSILDTYGGEYEWDTWTVKLWSARGSLKNFTIRYGVNLTDYEEELDYSDTYTAVIPYWKGQDQDGNDIIVTGAMQSTSYPSYNGQGRCIPLDVTDKFNSEDGTPTQAQVEAEGAAHIQSKQPYLPAQTIKVDFVRLSDSPEYAQFANLQKCRLCDSVNVVFPRYNMMGTFKIVKTEYDVLQERYKTLELGTLSTSLSDALGITQPSATTLSTVPTVPELTDISSQFTLGGAWTGIVKKAYKYGRMVFFHIEASVGTYTANYGYTIATVASGYRPTAMAVCNAYTTDGSYNPKAVVSARLETNGNLIVDSQNTTGSYFFVTGFYYV